MFSNDRHQLCPTGGVLVLPIDGGGEEHQWSKNRACATKECKIIFIEIKFNKTNRIIHVPLKSFYSTLPRVVPFTKSAPSNVSRVTLNSPS